MTPPLLDPPAAPRSARAGRGAHALARARRCLTARAGLTPGRPPGGAAARPRPDRAWGTARPSVRPNVRPSVRPAASGGAPSGAPRAAPRAPAAAPAAPPAAAVRAIRGATTVAGDDPELVWAATRELLVAIVERNGLAPDDLISVLFTVTPDLTRAFPARAACALGWADVPLLCALEIPVPGALPRCVRVLVHAATARPRAEIAHVYLGGAVALRPDLAARGPAAPGPAARRPADA